MVLFVTSIRRCREGHKIKKRLFGQSNISTEWSIFYHSFWSLRCLSYQNKFWNSFAHVFQMFSDATTKWTSVLVHLSAFLPLLTGGLFLGQHFFIATFGYRHYTEFVKKNIKGSSGSSLVATSDCKPAVLGSNLAISPAKSGLPILGWAAIWDGTPL